MDAALPRYSELNERSELTELKGAGRARAIIKSAFPWASTAAKRVGLMRRALRARYLSLFSREQVFSKIYHKNKWGSESSRSGVGSTLAETNVIKGELSHLLKQLEVRSILDAPCGDFNWMRVVDIDVDEYIGADIVKDLIESNNVRFGAPNRCFVHLDICADALPSVDMIFCRDCLVHLSERDVWRALRNFKASRSRYVLMTTFPNCALNNDIVTGMWRPLNLCLPPFNLPPPMRIVSEGLKYHATGMLDKSVALWKVGDLP